MKRFSASLCVLILSACSTTSVAPPENPWAKITVPAPGPARAIGRPGAGCVAGAVSLHAEGPGYRVMHITRRRFYGHPVTIRFFEELGRAVHARHLPPLLIGDIGMPRGGPMPSGHVSHQIGLDADVWFNQPPTPELTLDDREQWSARSVLLPDASALDPHQWGKDQEWVLEKAVSFDEVDRILVNPVIKRELCRRHPTALWLAKLRPWWGHDDHWHVRMKCPASDSTCVSTDPIPPGNGCDATLDWWFTDEARKKGLENDERYHVKELPKLPTECADVLSSKQ